MRLQRIDHVGIVVDELAAAKQFFLDLGMEVMGEGVVEGEWVERIIGLQDVKEDIVMLRTPDGEANIELVKFHTPVDEHGIQPSHSNTLGIRHIAFAVGDIDAIVEKLKANDVGLIGEVQTYEDSYKLCYVHGPENIILELAEKLN